MNEPETAISQRSIRLHAVIWQESLNVCQIAILPQSRARYGIFVKHFRINNSNVTISYVLFGLIIKVTFLSCLFVL